MLFGPAASQRGSCAYSGVWQLTWTARWSQGGEPCGILLGFGQLISANYQQQVVVQQANQRGELFIDRRWGRFPVGSTAGFAGWQTDSSPGLGENRRQSVLLSIEKYGAR